MGHSAMSGFSRGRRARRTSRGRAGWFSRAAAVVPVLAAALLAGCGASSEAFPFDRQTVWRAAFGQAIVWKPNLIDDEKYRVISTKSDAAGTELQYELEVVRDPNIFARRPSTRVYVSIRLTKPRRMRFVQEEREFLAQLGHRLSISPPPPK